MSKVAKYLLRGVGDKIWSEGLDDAAKKIPNCEVLPFGDWSIAATAIAQDWRKGKIEKIRLGGHSAGATAAVRVASEIETLGIPVDEMVLLDLHLRKSLPFNVRRCFSVKQPHPIFVLKKFYHPKIHPKFPGKFGKHLIKSVTHPELDNHPKVQELLIGRMNGTLGKIDPNFFELDALTS